MATYGVKTSRSHPSLCVLCLEGQRGQRQQTEGPASGALKGPVLCFSNEHSLSPWMHSDFMSYREPVNCCFHCMGLTGNLDIGQACFKESRGKKVVNRCNVLSYADHSPGCHGTPLPAQRAKCRRPCIDEAASLEMGMPLLKGHSQSHTAMGSGVCHRAGPTAWIRSLCHPPPPGCSAGALTQELKAQT